MRIYCQVLEKQVTKKKLRLISTVKTCVYIFFLMLKAIYSSSRSNTMEKMEKFKMHFIILQATEGTGKLTSNHWLPFPSKEAQDRDKWMLM